MGFLLLFLLALVVSSIGFRKFVWFISLGYGFSIAALGVALLVSFGPAANPVSLLMCLLLVAYGLRLGVYLLLRERRSAAYNKVMATQVNDGSGLSRPVQALVWATVALMYACQVSPVLFRLQARAGFDALTVVGAAVMLAGIVLESAADLQKSAQKRLDPHRFCDKGLFSFVRCPNYLGELLCWTGVFVSGVTALAVACGNRGLPRHRLRDVRRRLPARDPPEQELRRRPRVPGLREARAHHPALRPALQRRALRVAQGLAWPPCKLRYVQNTPRANDQPWGSVM